MAEGTEFALAAVDVGTLLLVAAISFIAALLGGVSAFGTGLIITPFLAPVVGVKAVVPVMAVAMTLGNVSRVWANWRDLDHRKTLMVLLPAAPLVVVGTKIYDLLPVNIVSAVIGLFLLAIIPLRRILAKRSIRTGAGGIAGISAGIGLISGSLPGGGILIVPLMLGMGLHGAALIASDGAISVGFNLIKMVMFGSYELLNLELLLAGLLVGLCTVPGAFTARWIIGRLKVTMHTMIVEALVIFGGLSLLWKAFV